MSTAEALWRDNADLAAAALTHPFVQGIAYGTLAAEDFAGYVGQDAYFLESFARAYALALAHSPDRDGLNAFADLLHGVREELHLHETYAQRWGIDLATIEPAPATSAYTDFLLATAAIGSVGQTCAAMTPCMRLYAYLGQTLIQTDVHETYAEWVHTYADPQFEALAATLEALLDRYVQDIDLARTTYRRAMRLELGFFDAAFTRR